MLYKGVIIAESLEDAKVLQAIHTVKIRREKVTPKHKTPWLSQWTLHTIEVPEEEIDVTSTLLSKSIESNHSSSWYIDLKNDEYHFIIFKDKVFKVDVHHPSLYNDVRAYGLSLGIPEYQMNFERLKR